MMPYWQKQNTNKNTNTITSTIITIASSQVVACNYKSETKDTKNLSTQKRHQDKLVGCKLKESMNFELRNKRCKE